MKKFFLFFLLVQLVTLGYAKQIRKGYTDIGIEIEYDFSDVKMTPDPNDSTLMHFSIDGCHTTIGEGIPALPFSGERFEIPQGVSLGDIQIQETLEVINAKCAPAELFRSDLMVIQSTQAANVISPYNGLWPSASAWIGRTAEYRDRTIGFLNVYPIRYDYTNQQVVISKTLKITIPFLDQLMRLAASDDIDSEPHSLPKDMFTAFVPLNLQKDYDPSPLGGALLPPDVLPTLMIIAPASFEEPTRKFGKWKQRMGYSVHIEIVDDETLLNPTATKQLIQNRYKTDKKLEYVLLMGGGDIIRPFKGRYKLQFGSNTYESVTYTDLYFACMDGDDDEFPDLIIGRFPAHNIHGINAMVNKTIEYEKNPPITDSNFYNTALHISEWIDEYDPNQVASGRKGYEKSNFIWTSEWFKNMLENETNMIVKRLYYRNGDREAKFYADGSSLDPSLKSYLNTTKLSKSDISNEISNGAWYILCRSHGNIDKWTNLKYSSVEAKALRNGNKLPIIFSINCNSGIFYNPEEKNSQDYVEYSLCEDLLRNPYGGGICAIGSNGESETHYNDLLTAGIFNQLYGAPAMDFFMPGHPIFWGESGGELHEFGKIFQAALVDMILQEFPSDTDKRGLDWSFYNRECFNCLGDPTLNVPVTKPIIGELETIRNGTVENDTRMIVQTSESGTSWGYTNLDLWGPRLIERNDETFSLVGYGYVPVLFEELNSTAQVSLPMILSVRKDGTDILLQLDNTTDSTLVNRYDIYGNKVESTRCNNDGKCTLSHGNGISIITVEENGVIVDQTKINN
ncbi:MAG: hypothetical protein K2M31_00065 [Muribaculaceae bacterium]|nr:hypothetical protein [Muribaculaceae bacterium]